MTMPRSFPEAVPVKKPSKLKSNTIHATNLLALRTALSVLLDSCVRDRAPLEFGWGARSCSSECVGQIRTLEFRLEGLLLTAENSTVAAWKGNHRSIGHE